MTVTQQEMTDAQIQTGNSAIQLLESVAAFGEEIQFAVRKPYDLEKDEFVEVRMKTDDFHGLIDMFTEVSKWVKDIVSFDSLDDVNAHCAKNAE